MFQKSGTILTVSSDGKQYDSVRPGELRGQTCSLGWKRSAVLVLIQPDLLYRDGFEIQLQRRRMGWRFAPRRSHVGTAPFATVRVICCVCHSAYQYYSLKQRRMLGKCFRLIDMLPMPQSSRRPRRCRGWDCSDRYENPGLRYPRRADRRRWCYGPSRRIRAIQPC